MIWFTLLWCLLWPAIMLSVIATIATWSVAIDEGDVVSLAWAVFGVFFSVFLGWALWAVYPYTSVALGG